MELLIGIAVLGGAIVLAVRFGHSGESDEPPEKMSGSWSSSAPKPSAKPTLVSPPRFDAKSAKHLHHERVLTGAVWVIDGDTVRIKNTQIRLFGIDAPELNHPYGKKAKWALHKMCKGHTVRAEITDIDHYGRTVARCYLSDGRDLSAEMVKHGLALDWPKFSGGRYRRMETREARKRLFLADARQKGRMHVWERYEAKQRLPR